MSEIVGAYWGPRAERVESGARRILAVLAALPEDHWYVPGSARPGPDDAVDVSPAGLVALLAAGTNRRDVDRAVITELGLSLRVWNGDEQRPLQLEASVVSTSTTPGILNSLVLKVPPGLGGADDVFRTLVEATDPDRATWLTRDYRRSQPTVDGAAYVGWQTYLTPPWSDRVRQIPDGVTTRPLGRGRWLTVGPEPGETSRTLPAQVAAQLVSDPS